METDNQYLLKRIEDCESYFSFSFSFRYTQYRRISSILKILTDFLEKNPQEAKLNVLDIGCGDGWLIFRLLMMLPKIYKEKLRIFGVDLSEFNIRFANQRKEHSGYRDLYFQIMDANNISLKIGQFDLIICSEVIEHMVEPEAILHQIHQLLKKDGILILTTPNKGGGIFAKLARFVRFRKNAEAEELTPRAKPSSEGVAGAGYGHISVKSMKEWSLILRKRGFIVKDVFGTGGLFLGSPILDNHRLIFAFSVILDTLLEWLPFSYIWSEILVFKLSK